MSPTAEIEQMLRADGQLDDGDATLTPLGGGVSCEIFQVVQKERRFVVKRALAKLRVADEWTADVRRNAVEHAFFESLADLLPGSLPRLGFHNPARGYFTMEYLDEDWQNWKTLLLHGCAQPAHGELAGTLLGKLHAGTWGDPGLRARFDTTANFRQLRTDPFFLMAAERCPEVADILRAEVERIESRRDCLVHGDFSPKNMLLKDGRLVLLDAEVAWFGEPAFDVAFLLGHLFLKGLYHAPRPFAWRALVEAFWSAYAKGMGDRLTADLEGRCARILAAFLLARCEGKSPVEYLTAPKQKTLRQFAVATLLRPLGRIDEVAQSWQERLGEIS